MKRDQNKCPLLPRHCTIDCRANLIGGECQAPIIEESNNSEKEENEELVAYYMKDREGRWILVSKGLYDSALNNRENARQFGYNEFKIVIGSVRVS